VGSLQCSPDFLAKFKRRRKEEWGMEWVKHEWSKNARWGRDQCVEALGRIIIIIFLYPR